MQRVLCVWAETYLQELHYTSQEKCFNSYTAMIISVWNTDQLKYYNTQKKRREKFELNQHCGLYFMHTPLRLIH